MEWKTLAERELIFFLKEYRQTVNDIHLELQVMDDDISYPNVYVDEALNQIRFYVPTVEQEVLRREKNRESCELALKKAHNRAKRVKCALESLSVEHYETLVSVYGTDRVNVMQLREPIEKALHAFYVAYRTKRLADIEEYEKQRKLAILKENGLHESPLGKKLA